MTDWIDAEVKCPFYKNGAKHKISCEGIANAIQIDVCFKSRESQYSFMNEFCCNEFKKCDMYKIICKKYD